MSIKIDTSSIDRALKNMDNQGKKARDKALKKAGNEIANRLKDNTPVDPRDRNKKHMKDDIVVSGVDQYGEVTIGFGKETYWRARFVELGTIKQRPQHFIENTEQEMRDKVMEIIKEELAKGLGL